MHQTATLQGKRSANWKAEEASLLVELVEGNYAKPNWLPLSVHYALDGIRGINRGI